MSYPFRRLMAALATVLALSMLAPIVSAQMPVASPAAYASQSTFTEASCPTPLGGTFVEGENQVCGTVDVPLFHNDATRGEADLFVTWLKSPSDTPGDPIVVLTGGPGQSSNAVVPLFTPEAPLWLPLLDQHDVILFDQRGTGLSTPSLACSIEKAANSAATPDASATPDPALTDPEAFMKRLLGCGDELRDQGIDLAAFDTTESAADVVDITHALGYDQVNLYGISYGSYLGQVVERDHPEIVAAAALASPLPLEANVFSGQVIGFDQSIRKVFDACAGDAECDTAYPGLEQKLDGLIQQLIASPLQITITDPVSGQEFPFPVDVDTFTQMLYLGTFVGSFLPVLPAMISQTAAGDTTLLANLITVIYSMPATAGTTQGVLFTFFCNDEVPYASQAETESEIADANVGPWAQATAFTSVGAQTYPVCDAWNLHPEPTDMNDPVVTDVPTLIVTGEYDPITPPSYGEQMLPNFANGYLVNIDVAGHDPLTTVADCGNTILLSFFDDPALGPDTSCLDGLSIDWTPDLSGLEGSPVASPVASPAG